MRPRILVVDDEPGMLRAVRRVLERHYDLDCAASAEQALTVSEDATPDIAILDIMGVQGFELLKIANGQKIPALMLTAHALDEESLKKSAEDGAAYFAPKEKMHEIDLFVADVLEALEQKKSPWVKLFERLGGFYDKRFHGPNWREQEQKFWEEKLKKQPEL